MKRSLALFTAVTAPLALVVSACGSPSATSKTAAKPTELLVTEWTNPPAIQATKVLDKAFEKAHPGVKVKLEYATTANNAWADLYQTTMQAHSVDVAANFAPGEWVPPSYMHMPPGGIQAYAAAGQLVNFKNQAFINRDFAPGEQKAMNGYRGGIWGVTLATYGNTGVFYKKALFEKYHLPVPATYNQLVSDCRVLKAHGVTPFFVGAKDNMNAMILSALMEDLIPHQNFIQAQNQLNYAFWHKTESFTSNPVWRKIFTRYQTLSRYFQPNPFGESQLTAPGTWASSNNYAMLVDGSWDGWTIHEANPKLKFGWFSIPGSNQAANNHLNISGDFTWTVPTFAPQKKLAIEYVKFFSEPKNYQVWENYVGAIPTENVKSDLPWMTVENQDRSKALPEISLVSPRNVANIINPWTNAAQMLQPYGPDTVGQLLTMMTHDFQSALP